MTRKRTKRFSLIAALALAVTLMFSLTATAFAADYAEGTETDPAQAAITKIIRMPIGTDIPAATFTFEFEAIEVDGVPADDPQNPTNMPGITNKSVTFTGSEPAVTGTPAGVDAYYLETGNIVAGITFPSAGIYKYHVTETANTYTVGTAPPLVETMAYSLAEYDIEVWVNNNAAGTATFVQYIVAIRTILDDGTPPAGGGEKVDPTPGTDPRATEEYSQMIFNNIYTKRVGGVDPEDPDDAVLTISKEVGGDFADMLKGFGFNVTVTKPAIGVDDPATYTGYKLNASGVVTGSPIVFSSGVAQTVTLAHGEKLVFLNLHVGSSFQATETVEPLYTPSYKLNTVSGPAYTSGAAYGMAASSYLREAGDIIEFTNTFSATGPMGILVDNLPYIAMIALAILCLVVYIAVKSRKNARYKVQQQ